MKEICKKKRNSKERKTKKQNKTEVIKSWKKKIHE